ncbi:MAG: 23S rRNA (pseudouridine(1915)-N(3))-methyltransferase RlmH [Lachnospiraceae bacterium]|nr:23S rRNA (pseudouridine(1915)-N(3))-methyltransferase RlmH [Lachnospiraceae bacterium]
MTIRIVCVGSLKERFFTEAVAEYVKRLGRYARVEIIEVADERTPDRLSEREREILLSKEAGRLLPKIDAQDFCIALCIDGKAYDSEGFSAFLSDKMNRGESRLCFVIGGSLGLSGDVISRANARISFSKMTFPHPLMRVILCEQIYRSFRIMRGEPYHK